MTYCDLRTLLIFLSDGAECCQPVDGSLSAKCAAGVTDCHRWELDVCVTLCTPLHSHTSHCSVTSTTKRPLVQLLYRALHDEDVCMCLMYQRRKWARLDLWEWSFLVVSTLNITLCIILSTLRLVNVVEDDANSPDFIFTIVLIVNSGMYC